MRKLLLTFILLPTLANAAEGTVSANLTAGITMTEVQQVYLSNIVVYGAGTVTITPNGTRVSTGNVQFKDEYQSGGRFSIKGSPKGVYKVQTPTDATVTNGKTTLQLTDFTVSPETGVLDDTGKGVVSVGCTIEITDGFTSGSYTGKYTITCSYE